VLTEVTRTWVNAQLHQPEAGCCPSMNSFITSGDHGTVNQNNSMHTNFN